MNNQDVDRAFSAYHHRDVLSLESSEFIEYGTRDRELFYLLLIHTALSTLIWLLYMAIPNLLHFFLKEFDLLHRLSL